MKLSSCEIRLLRLSRDLKQEVIGKFMGISKQRYSQLENNPKIRMERILEILKILEYTPESAKKYLAAIPPKTGASTTQ